MHLRPLMTLRRDKNPTCTQIFLLQNVQSWQLTCPQTVRKKSQSLKVNDIQTQSLTSVSRQANRQCRRHWAVRSGA